MYPLGDRRGADDDDVSGIVNESSSSSTLMTDDVVVESIDQLLIDNLPPTSTILRDTSSSSSCWKVGEILAGEISPDLVLSLFFDGDENISSGSSVPELPMEVATDDVTETCRFRFRVKTPKKVEAMALNISRNRNVLESDEQSFKRRLQN